MDYFLKGKMPLSWLLFLTVGIWLFVSAEPPKTDVTIPSYSLPSAQFKALEDLYDSTNGVDWSWKGEYLHGAIWNFASSTANPCDNWQGIVCTSSCGRDPCSVLTLELPQYNLRGMLPSSLGNLSDITLLNLDRNAITGTIPLTLTHLANLRWLNLFDNELTGKLPSDVRGWRSIENISLSENSIRGSLPTTLTSLQNLQWLQADNNRLTGSLPTDIGILSRLNVLSIMNNLLSGTLPTSLSDLRNLVSLQLQQNRLFGPIPQNLGLYQRNIDTLRIFSNFLSGPIPKSFANMTSILYLDFSENSLTGTLLPEMGRLIKCAYLNVQDNAFTSSIPDTWYNMSNMQQLYFDHNFFTGSLSNRIGELSLGYSFSYDSNFFNGTIPPSLFDIAPFWELNAERNHFSGTLPSSVGSAKALAHLYVGSNHLTGSIPPALGNVQTLTAIQLNFNLLNGTIPESFGSLLNLQVCYLYNNQLSGTIPAVLSQIPLLELEIDNNALTGTIPYELGDQSSLRYLYLNDNKLTGSIPSSLGDIPTLLVLSLYSNYLNSTIPVQLGRLVRLTLLELSSNALTGDIPHQLGSSRSDLKEMSVSNNQLTGKIPASLSNLTNLGILDLSYNKLSGLIPNQLSRLQNLSALYLNNNELSGEIPSSFEQFRNLSILWLSTNQLSGSIPASISSITALEQLNLYGNFLTGSLPEQLHGLVSLRSLIVNENLLSGSFPTCLCTMPNVYEISLGSNLLTGTLPTSCLLSIVPLHFLILSRNELSGDLSLTSSYQDTSLYNATLPTLLLLDSNLFVGAALRSLPSQPALARQLSFLNLSSNLLTGSVSMNLSSFAHILKEVDVSNNFFSGSLSECFDDLPGLTSLIASSNMFSGSLTPSFLNTSIRRQSSVSIDVSNNRLQGPLPDNLFQTGHLISFVASINCFSGSVSDTLCANTRLTTLLLDGLHAAESCTRRLFPLYPGSGYQSTAAISGSLPGCLLALPQLQTLHASGNGLGGSFGSTPFVLGDQLTSLVISHNAFTGRLSNSLWMHNFTTLDLSFNRFGGTLPATISGVYSERNDSSISLEVNRFSGSIPPALVNAQSISMLNGNLFSCNQQRSDLPRHDEDFFTYQCGSDNTNLALYVILTSLAAFGVMFVLMFGSRCLQRAQYWYRKISNCIFVLLDQEFAAFYREPTDLCIGGDSDRSKTQMASFRRRFHVDALQRYPHLFTVGHVTYGRQWLLVGVTSYVLVVALAVYLVLSQWYPTYTVQYVWVMSSTFITGSVSAITLLVIYVVLVALVMYWEGRLVQRQEMGNRIDVMNRERDKENGSRGLDECNKHRDEEEKTVGDEDLASSAARHQDVNMTMGERIIQSLASSDKWLTLRDISLPILINIIVVLTVNFSYVYAVVAGSFSPLGLFCVSALISIFKLLWYEVFVNRLFTLFIQLLHVNDTNEQDPSEDSRHSPPRTHKPKRHVFPSWCKVLCAVFNNIISPYLAEGLVSSDCFYFAFANPPAVSSIETTSTCYLLQYLSNIDVVGIQLFTTQTTAYCGNEQQIPQNMTIVDRFVGQTHVQYHPPFAYNYQCSSSLLTAFGYVFLLRYFITGIVVPCIRVWAKAGQWYALRQLTIGTNDGHGATIDCANSTNMTNSSNIMMWQYAQMFRTCTHMLPLLWQPVAGSEVPALIYYEEGVKEDAYRRRRSIWRGSLQALASSMTHCPSNNTTCTNENHINDGLSTSTSTGTGASHIERSNISSTKIHRSKFGVSITVDVAQDLQVRLWSDAAVLWTFGVLFPPLMLLICWSMLVDLLAAQWAVGSLLQLQCGLEERLAYYVMLQSELVPDVNNGDGSHSDTENHMTDDASRNSDNYSKVLHMTVLLQEDVTILHTLLTHLNHRFRRFGRLYRSASCCLLVLGTCFWSLTLFDVLGDTSDVSRTNGSTTNTSNNREDNVLAAVWLMVLMASAPLWLYLVAKYAAVLGRLVYDFYTANHQRKLTARTMEPSSADTISSPMTFKAEESDIEMVAVTSSTTVIAVNEVSSKESDGEDANTGRRRDVEVCIDGVRALHS